jgi:hypothetical protein
MAPGSDRRFPDPAGLPGARGRGPGDLGGAAFVRDLCRRFLLGFAAGFPCGGSWALPRRPRNLYDEGGRIDIVSNNSAGRMNPQKTGGVLESICRLAQKSTGLQTNFQQNKDSNHVRVCGGDPGSRLQTNFQQNKSCNLSPPKPGPLLLSLSPPYPHLYDK